MRRTSRSWRAAALLGAAAVALAGCAESERDDGATGGGEQGATGGTFVFAGSNDPVALDPAFTYDGESFRVARQIFEGLVGTKPGTPDPAPLLATEWEVNDDSTEYTFTLRDDVTFHDGEKFDAAAVCANFDRWGSWTGLAATEATSYYFGWFSIWFVLAVVVTYGAAGLVKAIRRGDVARTVADGARFVVTRGAVMAAVMGVILVPLLFTLIRGVATEGETYARSAFDLQINSVRPWQYLLPPHDNPIFDGLTADVIQRHTGVLPVYEQSVYLGIVPSLLALVAIVLVARGRGPARARPAVLPLLVAAAFMVVLSLGPRIPYEVTSIGDWLSPSTNPSFPGPVNVLFELSANFRYYGRTFVFTSVALAALAAIGFALLARRPRLRGRPAAVWGLSALAMVLVVAEFSPRPPNRFVDLRDPAWVDAVEELPADASIVNYPVADYSSPRSLFYTYWQTRHDHATVNPPETPRAQAFQRSIDDPDSFLAGRELARAGVDYAVVHTDLPAPTFPPYQPALPDDSLPRDAGRDNPYLREVRRTPDAVIYEVRDRPTRVEGAVVGFAAGWGEVEADPGGRWRWARNPEAVMNVFAARTYERATLSFGVTSFNRARRMDVLFDGRRVLRTTVPPDRVAELEIPLGRMTRGPHRLELVVAPGVERVDDVLKNGDLRFISVRVRTPRISVPRDGR